MKRHHKIIRAMRPSTCASICGLMCLAMSAFAWAQSEGSASAELSSLISPHYYVQKRASSYDRTGGNDDFRKIAPGATLTLLDDAGPAIITHIWITIASSEQYHLKTLVLRVYWDDEPLPSVESPIGDFFGLGRGGHGEDAQFRTQRALEVEHQSEGLIGLQAALVDFVEDDEVDAGEALVGEQARGEQALGDDLHLGGGTHRALKPGEVASVWSGILP